VALEGVVTAHQDDTAEHRVDTTGEARVLQEALSTQGERVAQLASACTGCSPHSCAECADDGYSAYLSLTDKVDKKKIATGKAPSR
jgi:hypothetical protein